ncbi:uncharacterized protein DUF4276 [Mucilaginibacter oryzae]|uniref:Uncharacterized protein DUF4276 n=1 Tax=Mucilaginibacter oryzae TaxID=468058 RepID=A0A316HHW8_9SPHI|nr:DUF4276 family protein [Mucilaginibacter oryzae]PWK79733.1 uncharacterized protein DUF4276 [Mucilaginibacter oryzae]
MIRLNITSEGFSEERFVTDILRPHLLSFNIYAETRKVLTNRKLRKRGGVVSYAKFKNDITQWFKECPGVYHTTLIDLYGLSNDFPAYASTQTLSPYERVAAMENALKADLNFRKFIPYIQLHEYESLLYSDTDLLEEWLGLYNKLPKDCFNKIKNSVTDQNPELINEGPATAPSKRILTICDSYDKINDGILIIKEIGLQKIRKECKHFDGWLTTLEQLK